MGLGTTELLIILVIVLLLFGATRLPRVARSMGEAIRELRSASQDDDNADPASN